MCMSVSPSLHLSNFINAIYHISLEIQVCVSVTTCSKTCKIYDGININDSNRLQPSKNYFISGLLLL